ncbi:hypothetical protein [Streptomyces sp. NPDC002521]
MPTPPPPDSTWASTTVAWPSLARSIRSSAADRAWNADASTGTEPNRMGQSNGRLGGGAESSTWLTWPLMATAWAAEATASPDRSTRTAPAPAEACSTEPR